MKSTLPHALLRFIRMHWAIILIVCFSFAVRSYHLGENFYFEYDQSRDFTRIIEIVREGDVKIVGPETDIPGIFNGALYYYFLAILAYFFHFNITYIVLTFILINSLLSVALYRFSIDFFHSKYIGIIAAILWSISYEQANFARYISNASLMIPTTTLFFMSLAYAALKGKNAGWVLSALGLGFAIHMNFYLIYLALVYLFVYLIFRPRIPVRWILLAILCLCVVLAPFAIAEYRWNLAGTRSLTAYFMHQTVSGGDASRANGIFNIFTKLYHGMMTYEHRIFDIISYSYFLIPTLYTTLLSMFTYIYFGVRMRQEKIGVYLLLWTFSTAPLFYFSSGVLSSHVINTSIFFPIALIIALTVWTLASSKSIFMRIIAYIACICIILTNLYHFQKNDFLSVHIFSKRPMLYADIRRVIEYTYTTSHSRPFSVCAITNPLFINTTWSFAYKTLGEPTFGYLPFWTGQPPTRNKNFLPTSHIRTSDRFLILEPPTGMKWFMQPVTIYAENKVSRIIEERMFGNITVQKRRLLESHEQSQPIDTSLEKILRSDPRYVCDHTY